MGLQLIYVRHKILPLPRRLNDGKRFFLFQEEKREYFFCFRVDVGIIYASGMVRIRFLSPMDGWYAMLDMFVIHSRALFKQSV